MSGPDKSQVYKVLNECTAVLNEDAAPGMANMYVTIDRTRYHHLLRAITDAKRLLIKPSGEWNDG